MTDNWQRREEGEGVGEVGEEEGEDLCEVNEDEKEQGCIPRQGARCGWRRMLGSGESEA